jgi:hypothetical protein
MMAFNHQQYNTQYLVNIRDTKEPINDAQSKYGVRIVEADVAEGETYWQVIGVHHLLPRENFSKHNVYVEALDEQGQRVRNPIAWVGWTWQGRRSDERADPVPLDKPDAEAAGNVAVHFGQIISMWIKGLGRDGNDKSDRVENLHTAHPDEPTPDGALLNTLGHHSFYVVFQRTRKAVSMNDGVITGRLERGQGHKVRLLKSSQLISEQPVDAGLNFRFDNLSAGVYLLEVVGTEISQDNLRLDPNNKVINLNLALPIPDDSVIFGQVQNGQGKTLLLIKEGNIIARLPIPVSEAYRFTDLAAGVYTLQVFETNVRQGNISVDGTNNRQVNLVVPDDSVTPPPVTEKTIDHYLLIGPLGSRGRKTNLLLALDFILAFSVTVGFSVEEAKRARQVTILGEGFSPADQQAITTSGSQVETLSGDAYDIEAELNARINAGRAFGG